MATVNDGGPAFPSTEANGLNSGVWGLSMRDWFAGQCIVGNCNWVATDADMKKTAETAYRLADAMIAARSQ